MDIWVARRIARLASAKLVYEVHDLWPASPIELGGMSPRHPFILLCQKAENDACRDADVVVSMLPKVAEHLQAHGLDLRKLRIVPNGITPGRVARRPASRCAPTSRRISMQQRGAGRTVVGYAGSHGLPNALDVLLDAAALLRDERGRIRAGRRRPREGAPRRRVRDRGSGERGAVRPRAQGADPGAARRRSTSPTSAGCSVPIYRFGIAPNKLMDYMMAGCAVLHSVEAGNDPVAEAGCGLTVAPESATARGRGRCGSLAAKSPAERRAMGERGRAFVLAHHTYPVLAQRFIEAVS